MLFPKHCSSLLQANEILLFNRKLTAVEACDRNLVTEVIPEQSFVKETDKKIKEFSELPPQVS